MSTGHFSALLRNRGFASFLGCQFLGALNDNLYRIIITLLAVRLAAGAEQETFYMTLAGTALILPFFLFSGYAGWLADIRNKRGVLIRVKALEIAAMTLAFFAFFTSSVYLMVSVLFLMALQSTFFSPAKYGIIPEMLPERDLSRANGLVQMTTFMAIILGVSAGTFLLDRNIPIAVLGLGLVAIAVVGWLLTLGISHVPDSGSTQPFRLNPWAEIGGGCRRLAEDKSLRLTVLGLCFFNFIGYPLQFVLVQLADGLAQNSARDPEFLVGTLFAALALGIGLGSLVAGKISGDKVELGLVPLGSIGMGTFLLLLSGAATPGWALGWSAALGFSGGVFVVPLHAYLQQRSETAEKGRVLATNSFLNTAAMLLGMGFFYAAGKLDLSPSQIILVSGWMTFIVTVYILTILPDFLLRFILWVLVHSVYRIRVEGRENVPTSGPVLLVCSHISYVDALVVGASLQRFVRFMVHKVFYDNPAFHWILRLMGAIPISAASPKRMLRSFQGARQRLIEGEVVCIFAEGGLSRTGNLLPFRRGFERIVEGLDVPVVPVHLDSLYGSFFSFKGGRFFGRLPRRLPHPVTVSFGPPLPATTNAQEARHEIARLASYAMAHREGVDNLLHTRFISTAKRYWFRFCMADSTGTRLNYGKALVGAAQPARWLRRHRKGEGNIGLVFPASVGGAMVNLGVLLSGKIPVNLNFTTGAEAMNDAIQCAGIRTVLTSRRFIRKIRMEEDERMVFLEDVMKQSPGWRRALDYLFFLLCPATLLERIYNREGRQPDDPATIIFSSGSTGRPKGVVLSHRNVLSNVEGFDQIFWVGKDDRLLGLLPFFHALGLSGTLWFPCLSGFGVVYHYNPMDASTVGKLAEAHRATVLITTPTFCRAYLRKCTKEQFAHLRYAIVGAEKLRAGLAAEFKDKFGLDLLEGYGCTEMSPVVSVNIPDVIHKHIHQVGFRPGSVGHPLPGVAARVVHPETDEPLPEGKEGLILVAGPGAMIGYLNDPEATAAAIQDGWYRTGDIGFVDADGFIHITDRQSRFSKRGGEMIPHGRGLQLFFGSCRNFGISRQARNPVGCHPQTSSTGVVDSR